MGHPVDLLKPEPQLLKYSFRFRRGKKDNFDDLLTAGTSSKKAKGAAASPKTKKKK